MKLIKQIFGASLLLCLVTPSISAQVKYGKTTVEELNMTTYAQDTTANAVILSNIGDIRFIFNDKNGFQSQYTLEMRVKILKNEGLEWCNQSIDYYVSNRVSKEEITKLEGTTYNLEDGKIVKTKLTKQHIFNEDAENLWKRTKFTMPAAKVGSVIEFKYVITSDFLYKLPSFIFQYGDPCEYTACEIVIPEYFVYNVNSQGYENIAGNREPANESFYITYRGNNGLESTRVSCPSEKINYEGRNISALKYEPYLWTLNDYRSKVSFELKQERPPYDMTKSYTTTWENIDKEIFDSGSLGGNLKKTGLFKEEVKGIEKNIQGASKIEGMIKSKVKWNEKNNLNPGNLKDVYKEGLGSSSDMNFLLINALNAAGFDAFPIILSTRANGRLPLTHPSLSAFNYVITGMKIDTVMYVTDASAKYGSWNNLPEKAMVQQARILTNNRGRWIDLSKASKGTMITSAMLSIDENGMHGDIQVIGRGTSAQALKSNYYSHKDEQEYIEKLAAKLTGEIDSFSIKGFDNAQTDAEIKYRITKEATLGDDYLYVNPIFEKIVTENPFKSETRKFPINFNYPLSYIQSVIINLPEGYAIEELPKSERVVYGDNKEIVFAYITGESNNQISLRLQYQINELLIAQTEYNHLKELYAKIVSKLSEQVVLKKIATE